MHSIVQKYLNYIMKDRARRRRVQSTAAALSALVVLLVFWQMKITGISMTDEALCGYLEHSHDSSCMASTAVCGLAEAEGHSHTELCSRILNCLDETHEQHEDTCYVLSDTVACGLEELEGHAHGPDCYEERLVCEETEHVHSVLCYSNSEADLESSRDWEQTLPERTGEGAADLTAIAKSQIGYTESVQNYKVAEDGTIKRGYTRYGEWYGNPYGDWSAMFASFCLNYAEHPAYAALKSSGVETMRLAAVDAGLYQSADAEPSVGDLVFLNQDADESAEAVAIIVKLDEAGFTAVEGDSNNMVAENHYLRGDSAVVGYAVLTEPEAVLEEPIANAPMGGETNTQNENTVTVSFVIDNENYTKDPGTAQITHVTVASTEGLLPQSGLTYTEWPGQNKYKVTGTGTLVSFTIPAGASLSAGGYALPKINVENMSPEDGRAYTYASAYSWVTDAGMICNEKTVFSSDTVLHLCLYESGTTCGLNWVCNCSSGGSHSITYYVSGFGSPAFTWGQSISEPFVPTADAVNSKYTGSQYCTAGPDHGMKFQGWYVVDSNGNQTKFTAGLPILQEYKDPNSDGYSVKIYARWAETTEKTVTFVVGETSSTVKVVSGEALGDKLPDDPVVAGKLFRGWQMSDGTAVTADTTITTDMTVTAVLVDIAKATFVNGETKQEISLGAGDALGENLPADPETPEGKLFLGWQIGESKEYADANTVILADTTYTAVYADAITVTFQVTEETQTTVTIAAGTALGEKMPEDPAAADGCVFAGWVDAQGNPITAGTVLNESVTLMPVFEKLELVGIYFHDIAPDGSTDYETADQEQDVQISRLGVVPGESISAALAEDPVYLLHDDKPAADCIWYTVAEDGTKTRYDLTDPVTEELHLYTYSYQIQMRMSSAAQAEASSFFLTASAAEITVNGDTLTLTLREGEKPTAADFVVNGVDYTLYSWTYTDANNNKQTVDISSILANGVTENIIATSDGSLTAVTTRQVTVNFYVCINGEWIKIQSGPINVYSNNSRYHLSVAQLEEVFGKYGFDAKDIDAASDYIFAHVDSGKTIFWTCTPTQLGMYDTWFIPLLTHAGDCDVYYLPANTTAASGVDRSNYVQANSFYTVTTTDPVNLIYKDESEIPGVQYVFTGETATVTVKSPAAGSGISWKVLGTNVNKSEQQNDDGTTTYTFTNVTGPIELTTTSGEMTVNFYVFVNNERKLVEQKRVAVYGFENVDSYCIPAETLESVYEDYDFESSELATYPHSFPFNTSGSSTIWSNVDLIEKDGTYFVRTLNNINAVCDLYYLPKIQDTVNGPEWSSFSGTKSFYTITVTDPMKIAYQDASEIPPVEYVFTGGEAVVTVKKLDQSNVSVSGGKKVWTANGVDLTDGIDNSDGTVTYRISNVKEPIVLVPQTNVVTVSVKDDNHLIYEEGTTVPVQQVISGDTAQITVAAKTGYGWLIDGKSITGGKYSDDGTEVTYTFENLKQDIVLTPVQILDSISLTYNINLSGTPTGTAPNINDSATFTESYSGGSYIVKTPSRTQYTVSGNNSLNTVVFQGWKIAGTDTVLKAGAVLTAEELSQYGAQITLNAVWDTLDMTHSVSFYINLELQVANFSNSTAQTPNENYTSALYGTEVKIEDCPQCDDGGSFAGGAVIEGHSASATAETDTRIRQLINGVKEPYMGEDRLFTLGTFPDDSAMLEKIRSEQQKMIDSFEGTEYYNPDDPTNVTNYRAVGTTDVNGVFRPTYRIICTADANGVLRYIPVEELTSDNYTIRWYVFKYDTTNGWHVDGVLVKKQAQLTVTKTFYGDAAAVEAVKNRYSIDVVGIDDTNDGVDNQPTLYTLTLSSASAQADDADSTTIEQGYTDYDPTTDTYTWVVNLTADWDAWLYERNYTYTENNIVTLSEYLAYNFTNASYNQSRTQYNADNGVKVAVKAHSIDQDYRTFETASFYNTYLPSAAVPISKVDDTGKPLTGVSFYLNVSANNTTTKAEIWKDENGIYYIYQPTDVAATKVDNGYITVDDMGYALVMGLKDKGLNYSFELVEATAPEGYTSIGVPIAFYIDDTGIHLTQNAAASSPDNHTIHVTNTSQTMSVTAIKNWADQTNKKVTLQLMLDDTPLPGKVAELDGTVDTVEEGVTDGFESAPWTVTWNNLPAYTGGTPAVYSIKETWIDSTGYDATFGDGYADYQVVVGDMQTIKDANGIPVSASITVTNRKQLSGLEFTKTNESGQALGGAVFQLYTDAGCTKTYGGSQTSGTDGVVSFGDLAAGTYYMKEIEAPDGYQSNGTIYTITVHAGKTTITAYDSTTPITSIVNNQNPATLNIQKVGDDGKALPGAVFELWKRSSVSDGNGEYPYEKVSHSVGEDVTTHYTVDANGRLVLSNLEQGYYKLVEITAPDGYYRLTEEIYFISEEGDITVTGGSRNWSFSTSSNTLTVINVSGSELPSTGGMGTHYGTMAGLLIMASSLLYGFQLRRKRERRAD